MARPALAVLLAVTLGAVAQADDVKLRRYESETLPVSPDPEKLAPRVLLKAEVTTPAVGLRAKDFVLTADPGELPVSVTALKVETFAASSEPLAAMILVQGNVKFMGSSAPDPSSEAIPGYYDVVKPAIDVIARARPRSTRLGLYVYGESVVEKVPLGSPDRVTGEALGPESAYAAVTTYALQRGLEEAVRVLGNEPGRRVLFVIGDGADQIEGYSVNREVNKLAAASIEVYVLGASPGEPNFHNQGRLEALGRLGAYRYAAQKEQVPEVAGFLANEMNNVYSVEFADVQPDGTLLPVDGKDHVVKIKAGAYESAELDLRLPGPLPCLPHANIRCLCASDPPAIGPACPQPPHKPWLLYALAATGVLGVGATVLWFRHRPAEIIDDEPPAPAPVPEAVPMPVPAPRRETFFHQALTETPDGMPIVGWIVPVNGGSAFQTFRLRARTTIGAGACDVRIEDPTMSGLHAEIVLTPGGYVLYDKGSLNGVRFCDRAVVQHSLIDNDLFTCGSTAFKFKTTLD